MKLDIFNELDNSGKFTYLIECLGSIDKGKDETWEDYEIRLKEWKKNSDVHLPEADSMVYMLSLIKKYNNMREPFKALLENNQPLLDQLLNEYTTYVRDTKLEKLV